MESSHNILRSSSQIPQKDQFDTFLQTKKFPFIISSRRTPSISSLSSSSSSSSSYNPSSDLDSPLSPATPHGTTFSGVPFSWEHFPGIPKKVSKKNPQESSSIKLLPLPPTNKKNMFSLDDMIKIKKTTSTTPSISNPNKQQQQQQQTYDSESDVDPFLAALIECSKEDDENVGGSAKVSRSLSDRFGFINLYASCKRTCAVAESIRHLPKSTTSRSSSYDLIKYPSR